MDTPDDDLNTGEETLDETFGDEAPEEGVLADGFETEVPPGPGIGALLLGALAAIVVAAVGMVLWGRFYIQMKRPVEGSSVVIGLAVGYVVRRVSRRSDLPARIVAAVITAVAALVGTLVAGTIYTANFLHTKFGDVWDDVLKNWSKILRHRGAVAWGLYAIAVLTAFLVAGPSKPKTTPATPLPEDVTAEVPAEDEDEVPAADVEGQAP